MEEKIDSVSILGVRVDKANMAQVIEEVEVWLKSEGKYYITTPNPEFIMAAQGDKEFRQVLNKADLAVPDGSRLGWASQILSEKNLFKKILLWPFFLFPIKAVIHFDTVPGVDLMERLCWMSAEKGFTVGFLGGRKNVALETAECLKKKYSKLKVIFAENGGEVDEGGKSLRELKLHKGLKIDILFVAFGQGKQEKWIAQNLPSIPVKVAMGVGGSFDYLSGNVMRAPDGLRSLGLEWAFRLITQPWRIKRQLILIKFVWLVLTN